LVEESLEKKDIDWILTATDLHKTYDSNGLHAVCGNTLGVRKGEVFGLLGPNGAGKSTTFSMLSMDEPRSDGEIQVLGNDIENISLQQNGGSFGMCPQYDSIWP
jgi:ABC-type multidrug transport system ATPase subunit